MKYEIQNCIASRLRRLSRITDGYLRKALVDFDITENQMNILFVLNKLGKVEQGYVGKILILERSSISRGIRLLEKQKYIKRTSDYRPEIELTKKGIDLVQILLPKWENFMDEIYEKIGDDGLKHISDLETKLN